MNAIFHQFKDKTMLDAYWLDIQPKNITVDKQNLTNKRTRHCQKPLSWPPCCTVFFDILGMLIYKLQRVVRVSLTFKSIKVYHNIVFC